jgi:hypothetical protein
MRIITFQKVLEESEQPQCGLGDRAQTPDGRQWVYAEANEGLDLSNATTRTANSNVDTVVSSTDGDGDAIYVLQASAGWTVSQFINAYGLVDSGTGKGQFFKIENNTADTLRLYKDYALSTALVVSDSDIVIVRPHLAEKTAVSTLHQIPIGVVQVAFTSGYFGWHLERGVGVVYAGAALVANELCTPGDNTEGRVITVGSGETADDASYFGRCLVANDTEDKGAMIDVNVL